MLLRDRRSCTQASVVSSGARPQLRARVYTSRATADSTHGTTTPEGQLLSSIDRLDVSFRAVREKYLVLAASTGESR